MTDLLDSYGDPVTKAETKTEDGREYPASAYAYVPDPDKPSTWKLRLWSPEPGEKETVAQIGAAVAALGPGGFRGNRVKIPADDLPGVKRRVLQAWLKVHSDKKRDDAPRILRAEAEPESKPRRDMRQPMHAAVDIRQPFLADGESNPAVDLNHQTEVEAGGGYDDDIQGPRLRRHSRWS